MAESFSHQIHMLLKNNYKPGDTFTSRDVAKHFGMSNAPGIITGFLFSAKESGALAVERVEVARAGLKRNIYRIVDLDKVKTEPHARLFGIQKRRLNPQTSEKAGGKIPAQPAASTSLQNLRGYLTRAVAELDAVADRMAPSLADLSLVDMSQDDLLALADRVMAELRRRMG